MAAGVGPLTARGNCGGRKSVDAERPATAPYPPAVAGLTAAYCPVIRAPNTAVARITDRGGLNAPGVRAEATRPILH